MKPAPWDQIPAVPYATSLRPCGWTSGLVASLARPLAQARSALMDSDIVSARLVNFCHNARNVQITGFAIGGKKLHTATL